VPKEFPGTVLEFEHWFRTEDACRGYLAKLRWPEGFVCPRCQHGRAWLTDRGLYRCRACKHAASLTAGTIFQDSRLPLRAWFRAAWWVTNQKAGLSALGLQGLLGLGSYETAWTCLHKLRRAMVRVGREQLRGPVEVDEIFLGGPRRLRRDKIGVFVAAEIRKDGIGRIRLKRIYDDTEETIVGAVRELVAPGALLLTDGAHSYKHTVPHGYLHHRTVLDGKTKKESALAQPRVHRISSLLKRWLNAAHQGRPTKKQIDHYLNEFVFRFNRRHSTQRGMLFYRLLQQAVRTSPEPYWKITSA